MTVLGVSFALSDVAQAQDTKVIKVGAFVSASGQGAFLGEAAKKALELYAAEINKAGGVAGRRIELSLYDSKTNAKDASTIAKRLIDHEEVDVLIGANTTGESMAVVPLAEEANVPYISIAGSSIIVEPPRKWVFKTPHTEQMSIEKIFKRIKKDGGGKVALLSGPGGYDQSCRKNAKEMAPQFGIELSADEQHGAGDADVTPQLTNIRNGSPAAVVYCGFGSASSIVAKNYKQLGLSSQLYMTIGSASRSYIEGAGQGAEGSRVTGSAVLAFKDLPPTDPIYAVTKALVQTYRTAYKEDPSTYTGYAYDALSIVVEAVRRTGSTDRAKIRDAIESLRDFPGINGLYSFSPTDHLGFKADSLRMLEVRNGEFHLLD